MVFDAETDGSVPSVQVEEGVWAIFTPFLLAAWVAMLVDNGAMVTDSVATVADRRAMLADHPPH
jgi:hypothetical protein